MDKTFKDLIEKFNIRVKDFTEKIYQMINDSFNKFKDKKKKIEIKEIEKWKEQIINDLKLEISTTLYWSEEVDIPIENNNIDTNYVKEEIKIVSSNELNGFTSQDIQEENREITKRIQDEAYNYMSGEEKIENENVASFLKYVAKISRYSYGVGLELFKEIEKNYKENNGDINLNDNEKLQELSTWVKKIEKEDQFKEYYNYILKKFNLFSEKEIKDNKGFFPKLFHDLTMMYFHCKISYPLVEINFDKQDDFNSDNMIDFINRGKNRKVNFVILPSLYSNGNFLQNGKTWVFTYINDTFKFDDDSINNYLNKKENY